MKFHGVVVEKLSRLSRWESLVKSIPYNLARNSPSLSEIRIVQLFTNNEKRNGMMRDSNEVYKLYQEIDYLIKRSIREIIL